MSPIKDPRTSLATAKSLFWDKWSPRTVGKDFSVASRYTYVGRAEHGRVGGRRPRGRGLLIRRLRSAQWTVQYLTSRIAENRPLLAFSMILGIVGGIVGLIMAVNPSLIPGAMDALLNPRVHEIVLIEETAHHLGDAENATLFPERPVPEGWYYRTMFRLSHIRQSATLTFLGRDIDPDPNRGPAQLILNKDFTIHLNRFVPEERHYVNGIMLWNDYPIRIPLPSGALRNGDNELMIFVGFPQDGHRELLLHYADDELRAFDVTNIDDIGFSNITLEFYGGVV